jgi:hypothetical protein
MVVWLEVPTTAKISTYTPLDTLSNHRDVKVLSELLGLGVIKNVMTGL